MDAFCRFEKRDASVAARRRFGKSLAQRLQFCAGIGGILGNLQPSVIEEGLVGRGGGNQVRPAGQEFQLRAAKGGGRVRTGKSNRGFDANAVRGLRTGGYFRQSIRGSVRVLRSHPGLREAQAIGSFPGSGLHKLVEEFDGFGTVADFFQERRGGIEVFVRIAYDDDQTAQKLERTGRVAGRDSNLGETQEVGGDELMILDFTSKDKLNDLASRLFVAGVKKLAGCRSKNFG